MVEEDKDAYSKTIILNLDEGFIKELGKQMDLVMDEVFYEIFCKCTKEGYHPYNEYPINLKFITTGCNSNKKN